MSRQRANDYRLAGLHMTYEREASSLVAIACWASRLSRYTPASETAPNKPGHAEAPRCFAAADSTTAPGVPMTVVCVFNKERREGSFLRSEKGDAFGRGGPSIKNWTSLSGLVSPWKDFMNRCRSRSSSLSKVVWGSRDKRPCFRPQPPPPLTLSPSVRSAIETRGLQVRCTHRLC